MSKHFDEFDDWEFDTSEDDPFGCLFPGKCVMPGEHLISECCTAEMMETITAQQPAAEGAGEGEK